MMVLPGKESRISRYAGRQSAILAAFMLMLAAFVSDNALATSVVAWGANNYGQSSVPAGLTNAVQVASGFSQSLAAQSGGTIEAWGDDFGLGDTNFPAGTNYLVVACGHLHSLALDSDGTVTAIGDDTFGQIENPDLTNVVAISCGFYHCLALKSDGTLSAWGGEGEVSYGQGSVPNDVSNCVAIAAGGYSNMALKPDGTVVAWGAGTFAAEPPDGINYGQSVVPAGLTNVVAIAAGGFHCLALTTNGTVVAWGDNEDGQTDVPPGLSNVVAIAAGESHSLALKSNGTVVAWGYNGDGETNVPGNLTNVIQIAAGENNSLAVVGNGPPVIHAALTRPRFSTNGFSVSLPSQNGRVYQLLYKNALTNGPWQSLPLNAGTGGNLMLTDPAKTTMRFYEAKRW